MTTINNFNNFIEQARDTLLCNSECQKEREMDKLKDIYLQAKTRLLMAPQELAEAKKNYYVYSKGENAYEKMEEQDLERKIQKLHEVITVKFDKEISDVKENLHTYTNLHIHYKNILELYQKYKQENRALEKELKDTQGDILTNDRKTFYENQSIERLQFIYSYYLRFIYAIFLIGYILVMFFKSSISISKRILGFILLWLFPYIAFYALIWFVWFLLWIYSFFPKP